MHSHDISGLIFNPRFNTFASLLKAITPFLILFFITLQSFTTRNSYELWVHSGGTDVDQYISHVYKQFDFGDDGPSKSCFSQAMKGYLLLKYTDRLQQPQLLSVIDLSLSSADKRFWVLDLERYEVLFHELTAHGKNSGDEFAERFSNTINSLQSSLGFFLTGQIYQGAHDLSLKLYGLEKNINHNAFVRGIVIHGADYVNSQMAQAVHKIGRSFGCPAVRNEVVKPMIETIANGSCLFIYHPQTDYQKNSALLNSDQYLPFEWVAVE